MKLNVYAVVSSKERPHVPIFYGRVKDIEVNGDVFITIANRKGESRTYNREEVKITEIPE